MILVIPYRHSQTGEELRYAIRSMVKHFKPLTGVMVIGDLPPWYTGEHVAMADIPGQKEYSLIRKIAYCAPATMYFLYSNDDFFALKDFDDTLPFYYSRTCAEMAKLSKSGVYRRLYEACNPDWKNFDIHVPMIMNSTRFRSEFLAMTSTQPIKTLYAHSFAGEPLPDLKIRGPRTMEEIYSTIKNAPFFSVHESAMTPAMWGVLGELYPNPSPYER